MSGSVLLCLFAGCDASELSTAKTLRASRGNVEYAIGKERHTASFGGVSCFHEDSREVMILQSNQQISANRVPRIPDLLRVEMGSSDEEFSSAQIGAYAVAYLPNVVVHGNEHPMVMFMAQDVGEGLDYHCVLKRDKKHRELTCQNVLIVPWRHPTTRPLGAFKAAFVCP